MEIIEISSSSCSEVEDAAGNGQSIFANVDGYIIGQKELAVLRCPGAWYTDEIINAYFSLLQLQYPQCHFFSTFFYTKLAARGVLGVERWVDRMALERKQLLFVPVNLNNVHWAMIVVDQLRFSITYYDSMQAGPTSKRAMQTIADFLIDTKLSARRRPGFKKKDDAVGVLAFMLAKTKIADSGAPQRPGSYAFTNATGIPRQQDGGSCGAFVCKYAECLAAGLPLRFAQPDVDNHRQRLITVFRNYDNRQK